MARERKISTGKILGKKEWTSYLGTAHTEVPLHLEKMAFIQRMNRDKGIINATKTRKSTSHHKLLTNLSK